MRYSVILFVRYIFKVVDVAVLQGGRYERYLVFHMKCVDGTKPIIRLWGAGHLFFFFEKAEKKIKTWSKKSFSNASR